MGKYCDNCGHELKAGAKFCPQCGQKVAAVEKDTTIQGIEEWKEIYQKTYRKAYAVAFQIMKNKEDAQDILQEAYISAFKNIESLKNKEKAGAWVNQIVANRCKDWLRKKNPALFSDMKSEDVDMEFEDSLVNENPMFMPEESIDYEETKKIMQNILDSLPEEQRLCILMYYYEELSVGEIAEALECSTGTVKSRLNYARKYIKTKVEELEKQGTKLYGIAPVPFIVWMLLLKENAIEAEAAERGCWEKIEKSLDERALKPEIENQSEGITGKDIGKAAIKSGGKSIAKKIIAGTITLAVIGTGAYIGIHKWNGGKSVQGRQETSKEDSGKNDKQTTKEMAPEFSLTEEQAERILLAAELFDDGKRTEDSSYFQGDYSLKIKKGKIDSNILKRVVSGIVCADKNVGESINDEYPAERKFLTTDECQKFLKDTFEYDADNWDEVAEVFYPSGNSGADSFEARYEGQLSEKYQLKRLEQTGKDKYHFFVEVSTNETSSASLGVMDITAHKNGNSKIAGFVFDKIEFSQESKIGKISYDINMVIGNMLRVKAESSDKQVEFNPIGTYKIDNLTNDEFINCVNTIFSESQYIAQDRRDKDENGPYDGYILDEDRYKELCDNTIGRKESYDYKEENTVKDGKVIFYGKFFGVEDLWFVVQDGYEVRSMDGTVNMSGTITDYNPYNADFGKKYYSFTAKAHEDSKSELGIVIDEVQVVQEVQMEDNSKTSQSSANSSNQNSTENVSQPIDEDIQGEDIQDEETESYDAENNEDELDDPLTDEQYDQIRKNLGVPESEVSSIETGTPYYSEEDGRRFLDVEFWNYDNEVVAHAVVDANTAELVKDILRYGE